uniref:DH domain-containing protein n=1 Tax=Angiostrongylus costaricensis TaxID=334426 RepID=A0A158PFF5_ANGCS
LRDRRNEGLHSVVVNALALGKGNSVFVLHRIQLRDPFMDEPSCSLAVDDGGTRRARSVTSSRISLFFARSLTKRHVDQQEAIWEIVTTDQQFLVNDCSFVGISRQTHKPLDPVLLLHGFEGISEWSKCYIPFNLGHDDSHTYVQKKQKDNELFREFVQWAESQESMRRQKLCDTLTSPMQRLTRYSLLLKAVLSNSTDDRERLIIQTMIDRTDAATQQLNFELNNNDLRLQMAEIMKSIDGYDAVDSEDEHLQLFPTRRTTLDLMAPMPLVPGPPQFRRVIHRGNLKIRESRQGPKMEMHCLLFTDMLLLCKTSNRRTDKGLRVARPPIHIAHMIYHPFNDASEFSRLSQILTYSSTLRMSANEFKRLQGRHSEFENSFYDMRKWFLIYFIFLKYSFLTQTFNLPHCISSMDSQVVAAHAHINQVRRAATVSSTEQLDRNPDFVASSNVPFLHKLRVSSCALSNSKSSVDLHMTLPPESYPGITLPDDARLLLELGPSFSPAQPISKETLRRIACSLHELQDRLRSNARIETQHGKEQRPARALPPPPFPRLFFRQQDPNDEVD